jgi:cobalt-zinc-cadmium efflux system outer membrane protein
LRRTLLRATCALALAGCVSKTGGYDEVRALVRERAGADVRWRAVEEAGLDARARQILAAPLTAERAVAVALYANRELQAAFEDLAVANAARRSALAPPNPEVETGVHFLEGRDAQFDIEVMLSLSRLAYLPLRGAAADAKRDAAELEVAGRALDLAREVRRVFYEHQAAAQILELRRSTLAAARAAWEATRQLHEAGNVTDLAAAAERARYEEARLDLARAETELDVTRERLSERMGLWGEGARWTLAGHLADPPDVEIEIGTLERRALERSLDLRLAGARHRAASRASDLATLEGAVPELSAGVEVERETEGWEVGPEVALKVPIFYQGQGEIAAADAEMRRQGELHAALAVRIRAAARVAAARLRAARERALFYQRVLVPLRETILRETELQYNAMAEPVFRLLEAKRQHIEARRAHVEALREYWLARADAEQLGRGRLFGETAMPSPARVLDAPSAGEAH